MEIKRILRRNKEGNKAGYNGFVYPEAGQIVECTDYINSDECGNGLHGWDDQNWRYYDDSNKGNYVVIDVYVNEGINFLGDKLKFKKGLVIYNGESLEEAKKFMFEKYQSFVFHNDTQSAGDSSTLSAGDSSTLSAGDSSTLSAGDSSNLSAGYRSTLSAGYSSNLSAGYSSNLSAGYRSTLSAGYSSNLSAGYRSTLSAGDRSTLSAGYRSTLSAGDRSTLSAGYSSTLSAGDSSTLSAGDSSTLSAGDRSTLSAGYRSTLSAGDRSTLSAGDGSFINFRAYRNCFNIVKPSKLCIVSGVNSSYEIAKSYTDLTPNNVYVFNDKIEIEKSYEFSEENIAKLEEFEIFVFGSNLNGNHAGGAARFAKDNFNAKEGIGEGLTGDCYAFPTLGKDMNKLGIEDLKIHVQNLFKCANENCGKIFLLTKVGCGIAGYDEKFMIDLFRNSPANIIKPKNW
jgi:hypothetical protein